MSNNYLRREADNFYQMDYSEKQDPVFSSNGSYNPTNLAIENSLKDIFDQFHIMVTGELKAIYWEEDDK